MIQLKQEIFRIGIVFMLKVSKKRMKNNKYKMLSKKLLRIRMLTLTQNKKKKKYILKENQVLTNNNCNHLIFCNKIFQSNTIIDN